MIERSASGELKVRLSPITTLYLCRQFLAGFVGILAVFLAVIFLIDLIELLRRASGKQDEGSIPALTDAAGPRAAFSGKRAPESSSA